MKTLLTLIALYLLPTSAQATNLSYLQNVLADPQVQEALQFSDIQSIELNSENISTTWEYNFLFRVTEPRIGAQGPGDTPCIVNVQLVTIGGFAGTHVGAPQVQKTCASSSNSREQ